MVLGDRTEEAAMARRRGWLVAAAALVVTLTGCGGDGDSGDGSATGTPTPSATSPADQPADDGTDGRPTDGQDTDGDGNDAPPFPANTEPDTADPSAGAQVTVTDIRIGRHDGFDRVVFEVDGAGTPGWDVRYVDAASSQGSGAPIEVAGEAILQVTVTGVGYPTETGIDEWSGPNPLAVGDTETVTEVAWDTTFEGTSVAFVGLTDEVPFRVYLLEAPARVVLEVVDPS
jgi:hypothetical protein